MTGASQDGVDLLTSSPDFDDDVSRDGAVVFDGHTTAFEVRHMSLSSRRVADEVLVSYFLEF